MFIFDFKSITFFKVLKDFFKLWFDCNLPGIFKSTVNNGQALENSHSDNLNGTKVTEKIDDEIEITYVLGQKIFARAEDPYEVKKNDVFSGNRPFKEVCNFDFPCYYILCHSLKNCFFRTKQKEPTWCWSTVNTKASK